MNVLDSILSIASGGITGLVGTALQGIYAYKTKKLEIDLEKVKAANELEQRKLDIQMQAQEWASRTQIAEVNANAEADKADNEALIASYNEPQQYSEKSLLTHTQNWILVLLDTLKACIRPLMTIYLCAITTMVYLQTKALLPTTIDGSFELLQKLIETILYLTTTCVLWWFGSRNKVKK